MCAYTLADLNNNANVNNNNEAKGTASSDGEPSDEVAAEGEGPKDAVDGDERQVEQTEEAEQQEEKVEDKEEDVTVVDGEAKTDNEEQSAEPDTTDGGETVKSEGLCL